MKSIKEGILTPFPVKNLPILTNGITFAPVKDEKDNKRKGNGKPIVLGIETDNLVLKLKREVVS